MNNITIRNIDPQNISINGGGSVIGITKVYVNGRDVTDGSVAYVVVPTKTSELQNDSGFITTETDPTVPYYVKQISLSDISRWNSKQNQLISGSNIKTINNNSILGSGNLEIEGNTYTAGNGISISDSNVITNLITSYNSLSDKPNIPTKTSDLINDSNFTTRNEFAQVAFSGSYLDLTDEPVIPQNTSDLYNDSGFITNSTDELENYMLKSYLDTILPKTTASGTSITLSDSAGTPLSLSLAPSELSQDSTPTPSAPQNIHKTTGNNIIKVEGKNICDYDINTDYTDQYLDNSGNWITAVGYTYTKQKINIITKTISVNIGSKTGNPNIRLGQFQSDGTFITRTLINTSTNNITLDNNCSYIWLSIDKDTTNNSYFKDISINYGSTATTYAPYVSQTGQINIGNNEFCKIGNYSDEFYLATDSDTELESGKWYIKKNIGKVVLDGSESYARNFREKTDYFGISITNGIDNPYWGGTNYKNNLFSDKLVCYSFSELYNISNEYEGICLDTANTFPSVPFVIMLAKSRLSEATINGVKDWLSNNNITIYYQKTTPTYTLLDNTIQEQLNNITKNLMSYTPQTNINQTNADLPFVISASTFKIIGG